MPSPDLFGLIVTLGLFLACTLVGAGLLWLWDHLGHVGRSMRDLDRCLTCRKVLRYRPATHDYERHRCRPRY